MVRTWPRRLRTAAFIAAALVGLFAFYVIYELGRYDAGYDRQAVGQQRTELEVRIERLEKENRVLRTQLAELDTFRVGRAHEQAEVAKAMGELQAQVAQQSQELAFYRGVVASAAANIGIKIGQVRISAADRPGSFSVHFTLQRSGRVETDAAGTVVMSLDGSEGGEAASIDFWALTGGRTRELRYSFRYFQDFDQPLLVPSNFKPAQLQIEVRSTKKEVAPLAQSFLWTVETTP